MLEDVEGTVNEKSFKINFGDMPAHFVIRKN